MKSQILKHGGAQVEFSENTGAYSIKTGTFSLENLRPMLKLNGVEKPFGSWKAVKGGKNSLVLEAQGTAGKWRMAFSANGANSIEISFGGKLKKSCDDIKLFYFDGAELKADHILTQGVCMGSCESIPMKKGEKKEFTGYYQAVITKKDESLRLSFPMLQDHVSSFAGTVKDTKLTGFSAGSSGIIHYSPTEINLAPLTIRSGDGFQLLRDYAAENTAVKRDYEKIVAPGWNSWDYYRWTITEDEVLANAERIAKDPVLSKHVKRIIVDDGWQYCYGEWDANSLFPGGMEKLAKNLSKMGFEPGVWICPTIVEPHSWIAQMEYDMMAKGESGHPCLCFDCMRRKGFVLDPTVDKAVRFMQSVFDRHAKMGYKYFKLDFLGATLNARQFADKTVPRGQIMRRIVEPIRDAVKGRALILGCNYHFDGGMDIVDAVRVGGDIHSRWDSIKHNTVSVAARFWANKKLWINDPDFALCRSFDTSEDPNITRLKACLVFINSEDTDKNHPCAAFDLVDIKRPQVEVLLSIVIGASGAVNLSDKMSVLNKLGMDFARRAVSAESGEAAVPLDLFQNELPKYWVQKVKSYSRVLLVNWEDTPAELSLDLRANGVSGSKAVNFWTDESVSIKNGKITAKLAPRSCLFATVK